MLQVARGVFCPLKPRLLTLCCGNKLNWTWKWFWWRRRGESKKKDSPWGCQAPHQLVTLSVPTHMESFQNWLPFYFWKKVLIWSRVQKGKVWQIERIYSQHDKKFKSYILLNNNREKNHEILTLQKWLHTSIFSSHTLIIFKQFNTNFTHQGSGDWTCVFFRTGREKPNGTKNWLRLRQKFVNKIIKLTSKVYTYFK